MRKKNIFRKFSQFGLMFLDAKNWGLMTWTGGCMAVFRLQTSNTKSYLPKAKVLRCCPWLIPSTLSTIIMEVENCPNWNETNLGGTFTLWMTNVWMLKEVGELFSGSEAPRHPRPISSIFDFFPWFPDSRFFSRCYSMLISRYPMVNSL